ncbi:MAG: cystathionine beta-synthase [Proteobacteria bacterium]|nr:cystathionine beta-synthase [Pseudomonadota bacterium]
MQNVHDNILSVVGNTPLVKLNSVTAGIKATVYAKVEFVNPGSSVKDRIAMQIIEDAEKSGELKPGGTIVEATSGNTGAGLAMAAAIKGYKCIFVLPDKQSEEKRAALRAYGAKVVVTPTNVEADDPRSYYSVSRRIADETPNSFYANQYHNPSNPEAHYRSTGPELYKQLDGKIDAFIGGLGTGGTITGTGKYLKEQNADIRIVGVDPVGSLYYDYFQTGTLTEPFSYLTEGIGEDFLPTTMDFQYVDDVVRVGDRECFEMTRRLAREEGLFVGGSCGAAVAGALKYVKKNDGEGKIFVVLLPDHGSRYLSKVYNDKWLEENGMLEPAVALGTVRDVLSTLGDRETITVPAAMKATEAIGLLKMHGISQMPVVNADGSVVGLIHERKLLEAALKRGVVEARCEDLADSGYCTVSPYSEVSVVTDLLRKVRLAIVMNEAKEILGVITRIDIIDHVARVTSADGI